MVNYLVLILFLSCNLQMDAVAVRNLMTAPYPALQLHLLH